MNTYEIRFELRKSTTSTRQTVKTVHVVAKNASDAKHYAEASEGPSIANIWHIDTALIPEGTVTLINEHVSIY